MVARSLGKPVADDRGFVCAVVDEHDQMYLQIFRLGLWHRWYSGTCEHSTDRCRRWSTGRWTVPDATSTVLRTMRWCHGGDSHGPRRSRNCPGCMGSTGWVSSSGLNLRPFRRHEHQRSLGRIQVKPDHVSGTFSTSRGSFESDEGLRAVRLEAKGSPDTFERHDHRTQFADRFVICRVLQCVAPCIGLLSSVRVTHLLHLLVRNLARRTGSGLIQQSIRFQGRTPNRDRHFPTVRGDTLSLAATPTLINPSSAARTAQHDRGSNGQTLRRFATPTIASARISGSHPLLSAQVLPLGALVSRISDSNTPLRYIYAS